MRIPERDVTYIVGGAEIAGVDNDGVDFTELS